jgi:integral membrane protein
VQGAVLRYRVMAYITGVLIIVIVFAGIPLQLAADNTIIVNQVGTAHGFLYIVYIIMAWLLAIRLKLAKGPTVLLLLAGTVPVMTFIVERWLTRRYIAPALAAAAPAKPAGEAAGVPSAGQPPPAGQGKAPGGRLGQWLHGS